MARKHKPQDAPADPLAWMTPSQRERHDLLLSRLITPPTWSEANGVRYILYLSRDDDNKAQLMMWRTDEEPGDEECVQAFHDAAHGIGAFAKRATPRSRSVRRAADERALIRAIVADREEVTGYLAYADYLIEHDDPRGDIVRLSVQLESMERDDPQYDEVSRCRGDLVERHGPAMCAALGTIGLRPEIDSYFFPSMWIGTKGVIDTVQIDRLGVVPEQAARLFAAAPFLRKLEFKRGNLDVNGLARMKQLAQIEQLELFNNDVSAEDFAILLKSNYLNALKVLVVGGNPLGERGMSELAQSEVLAQLHTLNVDSCGLSAEAVKLLVESPKAANLRTLSIGANRLRAESIRALAASPFLAGLTELDLHLTTLRVAAMRHLATATFANDLRTLSLRNARFDRPAWNALASCLFPSLTSLNLGTAVVGTTGADALAQAPFAHTLTALGLDVCELKDRGLTALARGSFPQLRNLDLTSNGIGDAGLTAFAESNAFPALHELRISNNRIGNAGAQTLADSQTLTHLRSLSLSEKGISDRVKKVLTVRFGDAISWY